LELKINFLLNALLCPFLKPINRVKAAPLAYDFSSQQPTTKKHLQLKVHNIRQKAWKVKIEVAIINK
jgi:hypothetical protein